MERRVYATVWRHGSSSSFGSSLSVPGEATNIGSALAAKSSPDGYGTGEEFDAFLKSEIAKYARVIRLAGIKLE